MLHDAARARCPRKAMTWRKRSATLGTAGWGKTVQEGKWSGKAQLTQASQLSRQATSQYLQQGSNSGAEPYSSWLGYWILYLQHTAIAKKSHPLPPENKLIPLSPPLWRKINGESVPEEKKKKKKKGYTRRLFLWIIAALVCCAREQLRNTWTLSDCC